MQKYRFFLKGSAAEQRWLSRQAQHGWQLTAIDGYRYQFTAMTQPQVLRAEYVPATTVRAMTDLFAGLVTYQFKQPAVAVVYAPVNATARVVTADASQRLAVYRHARDVAINWLNGWVVGLWLLMCAAVIGSAQGQSSVIWTTLLVGGLSIAAVLMLIGMLVGGHAALTCHRQVRALIQQTGDTKNTWQPTFHIFFQHQAQVPDTEKLAPLGKWLLTMHNQQGDYWFDVRTSLNQHELQTELKKVMQHQDFKVVSWLGLYPF
ncbi:hypothetical protein [Lactiplantibacillus daowaiensis]|uniref:DUF2812 domain-containing protein n=1 Tax=Lactiplantibacillus daowaiensis TaxID=2559918 RepID=A0ABW1RZW2_9LACO|nr:hypothetical protein [Lactiplantibacillus daowaiensis]